MTKKLLGVLLCLCCAVNAQASKDRGIYAGGGFSLVDVGAKDNFKNDVSLKVGELILGYKYNSYLGAEIRGGTSFAPEHVAYALDDSNRVESAESSLSIFYAGYYRAEVANEIAKLYMLLGASRVTQENICENNACDAFRRVTETGLSYGLGFGMWLSDKMNLNFEYKRLIDTRNDVFTSVGVNADFRF